MQFQCQPVALFAKSNLAQHAGAKREHGVTRSDAIHQGLASVVRDVQQGLDELFMITPKFGNRDIVVTHHAQALGKLGQNQRTHPLADLVDIDVTHHVWAAVV